MFDFISKIFNEPTAVTTYSTEEIQGAITMQVIAYMELLKKEITKKDLPVEIAEEYKLLQSIGFSNSQNMKRINEIKKIIDENNAARNYNIEAVKFMSELYALFGKSCLLIKFEDFLELLNKYNLVCGELKDYTGAIPLENLREIKKVQDNLYKVHFDDSSHTNLSDYDLELLDVFNNRISIPYPWEEESKQYSYPLLHKHYPSLYKIYEIDKEYLNTHSKERVARFPFLISNVQESRNLRENCRTRNTYYNLFIAAPSQEIKTQIKNKDLRRAQDPFICSYTDFGIVIYSKWGDEANDQIFNRYEELKKVITEKIS